MSDPGRGIEPERLPYVFWKFSSLDEGSGADGGQSEALGSGLGLAICKGIVKLTADGFAGERGTGLGQRVHVHPAGLRRNRE